MPHRPTLRARVLAGGLARYRRICWVPFMRVLWAVEAMRRTGGGSIVNISSISALWHGRKTPGGFPGYDVAKLGVIRLTERSCEGCCAGWHTRELSCARLDRNGRPHTVLAVPLTPEERAARGVPSKLLSTAEIADMVVRLATDQHLKWRCRCVVVRRMRPRPIEWGDRGAPLRR